MHSKNSTQYNHSNITFHISIQFLVILTILIINAAVFCANAHADAKAELDSANEQAATASAEYDAAQSRVDELNEQVAEKDSELSELEEKKLPQAKKRYEQVIRQLYKSDSDLVSVVASVLCGSSLSEVIDSIHAYEHISSWRASAIEVLKSTQSEVQALKSELDSKRAGAKLALEDATSRKAAALDAQAKARTAYEKTLPENIPTTRRAATSTSFHDEESAKAFIVYKESRGRYDATNGRYIGAYQLDRNYLNGDFSPENQDRTAERYVKNRYGSWMAAANFWVSHGWY